ncbi:MAG: response regulator transcription factor [Bdellovibrionota bacterium]
MSEKVVLVVEDDADILELIRYNLSKEGLTVETVMTGEQGLEKAKLLRPDLVLLDIMLPGMDGLEVCRALKQDSGTRQIPVIMLTAKGEESDVVRGLELGADDYITKPFSPKILAARVRAAFRRKNASDDPNAKLRIRELVIDPRRHEVFLEGRPLTLTLTEFKVLHFLARQPGWVFTRYQIVDSVKGEDYPVTDRSVDVQIVGLRKKLGHCGNYIETVRGVGYRFQEAAE